jgi:putative phosphoserine phosphatase/1-acylglycerol-3-phosphate O-acyltransferase
METVDGVLTGAPEGKYCFGDEKRVRLLSFCDMNLSTPADSWYYADSIADLPVLEIVGHPVCVSPDRKLASIARKRNWRIM